MHELALAVNILEIATEEAQAAAAGPIRRIVVEVGQLAGVENEALAFCFELARNDTPAAEAVLEIVTVDARGRCSACDRVQAVGLSVTGCDECGGGLEIVEGRELRVRSIDVD